MPTSSSDVTATPLIRVLAAVIREGDRYLACQRPAHKRHGGLWEFPGGKVEKGESDLDGMRRELREELGVEVVDLGRELFAIHDADSPFLIVFKETTIQGTPVCIEHIELRWGQMADLAQLPLAPSDRRFAERVLASDDSPR